jgi:hypothetical protein
VELSGYGANIYYNTVCSVINGLYTARGVPVYNWLVEVMRIVTPMIGVSVCVFRQHGARQLLTINPTAQTLYILLNTVNIIIIAQVYGYFTIRGLPPFRVLLQNKTKNTCL